MFKSGQIPRNEDKSVEEDERHLRKSEAPEPKFSVDNFVRVKCSARQGDKQVHYCIRGIVKDVYNRPGAVKGKPYQQALRIHGIGLDGEDTGPIFWNPTGGCDELPDFEYGRLKMISPDFAALNNDEQRYVSVLRSHINMRGAAEQEQCALDSSFDEHVMTEDGLLYILRKLATKKKPNQLIDLVTDGKKNSLTYLAYLLGRLIASEIGLSIERNISAADMSSEGEHILEALEHGESYGAVEQLQRMECPFFSVLLLTVVTSMTYDSTDSRVFHSLKWFDEKNSHLLDKRIEKILTSMSIVFGARHGQDVRKQLYYPSAVSALRRGCKLMMESNGGVRDALLKEFAQAGISWPPNSIRDAISDAAAVIPNDDNRKNAPSGTCNITVNTIDNIDFHVYDGTVNNIVAATIKIGCLPIHVWRYVKSHFQSGFAHMQVGIAKIMMPDAYDDKVVLDVIHGQNGPALLSAMADLMPKEGSEGKEDESAPSEEVGVVGVLDGGGRHRAPRATTKHTLLIDDASTKHSDQTREAIQKIAERTPGFKGEPRFFCCDQELIVTIMQLFFLGLAASSKSGAVAFGFANFVLPLIGIVGYGHALKNVASSMFTFHRPWLYGRVFAAMGYEADSARGKKLEKVSHIERGTRTLITVNEGLRKSAAKAYLRTLGKSPRISLKSASGEGPTMTPFEVLMKHIKRTQSASHPNGEVGEAKVVLDPFKRPKTFRMTEEIEAVSTDLMRHCLSLENDDYGANAFGPGGHYKLRADQYLCGEESMTVPLDVDPSLAHVFSLPYRKKYGVEGLLDRCKSAGIPTRGQSSTSLAKRLYAYLKAGGGNDGLEAASKCSDEDRYKRPTPPATANIGAKLLNSILFGPEGAAPIMCALFCRVRDSDESAIDDSPDGRTTFCDRQECRRKNDCKCAHHHKLIVMTKVLALSCFMRRQVHYRKICVYSLLLFGLILEHADSICRRVIIRCMRWTASVCVWVDSWKATCAEMAQETTVIKPGKQMNRKKPSSTSVGDAKMRVNSHLTLRREEAEERAGLPPLLYAKPNDTYYRQFNAWQHMHETLMSYALGFMDGVVVSAPAYPHKVPQSLAKPKPSSKRQKRAQSSTDTSNMLHLAETIGQIAVMPDHSMFEPLSKSGGGKSKFTEHIVKHHGPNEVKIAEGEFGYNRNSGEDRRPVILFKHKEDAVSWASSNGSEKVLVLVDGLKDTKSKPMEREGGEGLTLSVRELGRRMIAMYVNMYCEADNNVLIFWDVEESSTVLRGIQRLKRDNEQISDVRYLAAMFAKDVDMPLDDYGSYGWLTSRAKESFGKLLAEVISNELTNDDPASNWSVRDLLPAGSTIAFVGGKGTFCCGAQRSKSSVGEIEVSSGAHITTEELKGIISGAAPQGEGERMLFHVAERLLLHAISQSGAVDTTFDFRSEDTDALCGLAMPFVYRLQRHFLARGKQFCGRILLRGHSKSSDMAYELGQIMRGREQTRAIGTVSGEHLLCYFDLVALYICLEKDDTLPDFADDGQRAMSLTALYTFTITDYTFSHLTPAHMFASLRSDIFKNSPAEERNLLVVKFNESVPEISYNVVGMWHLFVAAMVIRDKTNEILSRKYSPERLLMCLAEDPLTVKDPITYPGKIRPSSVLGSEAFVAPTELGFMSHGRCRRTCTCLSCLCLSCLSPQPSTPSMHLIYSIVGILPDHPQANFY